MKKTHRILTPGQRGTYAGFPATVVRHYDGNMYEIRVPGGMVCVDAHDFIPEGVGTLAIRGGTSWKELIGYDEAD